MRCEEFQPLIEDYFDGELIERKNELVAQHMSVCASCASLYQKLLGEQELYLRYECDATPAPDFWDNVMARSIEESGPRSSRPIDMLRNWLSGALGTFNAPRFSPSLTALFVLIAIGLTIGVMRYINSREKTVSVSQNEGVPARVSSPLPDETNRPASLPKDDKDNDVGKQGSVRDSGSEQPQLAKNNVVKKERLVLAANKGNAGRVNLNTSTSSRRPTSDELVREAEQKYVEAIAMLSRDVNRRRSRLDAETVARFEQTLAAVNRTIADTRRAARKHPGDPVATQYMLTAYARKVDVLREMVGY